jgi:hypothetical protein
VLRLTDGIRRRLFMDDRESYFAGLAIWQQSDLSGLDT